MLDGTGSFKTDGTKSGTFRYVGIPWYKPYSRSVFCMDSDITNDDIIGAASRAGLTVTAAETEAARAHLIRQTERFKILRDIDTDAVSPYFGDAGFAVKKADE